MRIQLRPIPQQPSGEITQVLLHRAMREMFPVALTIAPIHPSVLSRGVARLFTVTAQVLNRLRAIVPDQSSALAEELNRGKELVLTNLAHHRIAHHRVEARARQHILHHNGLHSKPVV